MNQQVGVRQSYIWGSLGNLSFESIISLGISGIQCAFSLPWGGPSDFIEAQAPVSILVNALGPCPLGKGIALYKLGGPGQLSHPVSAQLTCFAGNRDGCLVAHVYREAGICPAHARQFSCSADKGPGPEGKATGVGQDSWLGGYEGKGLEGNGAQWDNHRPCHPLLQSFSKERKAQPISYHMRVHI